jgi:hypothetical protein
MVAIAVALDQNLRVNGAFELPVVTDEPEFDGIGERFRYRIAGSPHLHVTIVDGGAEEVNIGRRIAGVDVSAALLQIALREGFYIPVHVVHCGLPGGGGRQ